LQFSHSELDFTPLDIFDFVGAPLEFAPGTQTSYCSVNFMLLGYVVAYFQGAKTWRDVDQEAILPPDLRPASPGHDVRKSIHSDVPTTGILFVDEGLCAAYTRVHGLSSVPAMLPSGQRSTQIWDVSNSSCVAGWTAGNVLMSVGDAAEWTYALYGPKPTILPISVRDQMLPEPGNSFYGLATFNLTGMNGYPGEASTAYGHLGDTYGFTSIIIYFPALELSLTVATNLENGGQDGPLYAVCASYHLVADALHQGQNISTCTYEKQTYYHGKCMCR